MTRVFLFKNDNLLKLAGLKDNITDVFVNNATVTATITTLGGAPILGTTFPVTLNHVTGSDGDYQTALPAELAVKVGQRYKAVIDATANGADAHWVFTFSVLNRTG